MPDWMTRPESAEAKFVTTARLPIAVLMALRSEAMTGLSSCEQIVQEGSPDVSAKDQAATTTLRKSSPRTGRRSPASGAGATAPGAGAVDAGSHGNDAQGGRR